MNPDNNPTLEERVAALEQQLRGMDDVVAQRCLLVLNLTNIQHEQSRADIEQLISAGRLAREDINKLTASVKTSQSNIELLSERMGQLAQDIADLKQFQQRSIEQANRDREQAQRDRIIMLQILQFLQNQYPGNGKGGN